MNLYQMSQNLTDLPNYFDLKVRYNFFISPRVQEERMYISNNIFYLTKRFTKVLNDN